MSDDELLQQVTIAEPCTADWDALQGDDRIRFCALCGKHVYNLGAMSTDETACLIRARDGNLCARMRVQDHQVAPRHQVAGRRGQFHIRFIIAVVAGVATLLGLTRTWWRNEQAAAVPRPRSSMMMGVIACPRPLTLPAGDGPADHAQE